MLIYAHRGASAHQPANTMAAFRRAIADGADGIEFDVHRSSDGVPVVLHDRKLERTTNGRGFVDGLPLSELRRLDAGNGQTIPTAEEVVALAAGRLRLYIEMKRPGVEAAVLEVLKRFPHADWIAASFDATILETIRALAPESELWLITMAVSDETVRMAQELSISTISLWSEATSLTVAARLFEADLDLAVWTVNDIEVAHQARLLGASALCTDDPGLIRQGLQNLTG